MLDTQRLVKPSRNLGIDLVRLTEAAALTAARWMGLGHPGQADQAATRAMCDTLNNITEGEINLDQDGLQSHIFLRSGALGAVTPVDLVLDPIDGHDLLAFGYPGAISVMAGAPCDTFWRPGPARYMDKLVVDAQVAEALVSECLDAPAAWTLALVARAKGKQVGNLTVFMLDRPRHANLIQEIRATGAHIMLRTDGDITGAVMAATPDSNIDLLMGVGGVTGGLIAACAVKALGGRMLCRLEPQSEKELNELLDQGIDMHRIMNSADLVASEDVFFAATGITDGPLLEGIRYQGRYATSNSMILRGETGTRRIIHAQHRLA
ncbi:MAG: fructose-bisphosphatase class II family protein [Anaerolineae bacterium]|nr:fructose-bisphosphatase class II family protein [Anaerolineae bacterium]